MVVKCVVVVVIAWLVGTIYQELFKWEKGFQDGMKYSGVN